MNGHAFGLSINRITAAGVAGWLVMSVFLGWLGAAMWMLWGLGLLGLTCAAWWIARGSGVIEAQEFLCPAREDRSSLIAGGAAAEWISGFGLLGLFAAIATRWLEGFALIGGLVGGWALSVLLIAPMLAASGARTLPEWFAMRYGARCGTLSGATVFVLSIMMIVVQAGLFSTLAAGAVGMPATVSVSVVALVTLISVHGGGRASAMPIQTAFYVVMIILLLVPLTWLATSNGLFFVPHLASGAPLHEIAAIEARYGLPDRITYPYKAFDMAVIGLTVMLGTAALPHTQGRIFSGASADMIRMNARRTGLLILLALAAIPFLAVLLRAQTLSLDGSLLDGLDAPEALALALRLFEPPAWLLAALGMAVFAAVIAACAGAALAAATAFDADTQRETAGRIIAGYRMLLLGAVGGASVLAIVIETSVIDGFLWVALFAAATLLAPVVLGLWWARMNAAGAIAGIVTGALACLLLWGAGGHYADLGAGLGALALSAMACIAGSLLGGRPSVQIPARLSKGTDKARKQN